jgi:hypothetical protein
VASRGRPYAIVANRCAATALAIDTHTCKRADPSCCWCLLCSGLLEHLQLLHSEPEGQKLRWAWECDTLVWAQRSMTPNRLAAGRPLYSSSVRHHILLLGDAIECVAYHLLPSALDAPWDFCLTSRDCCCIADWALQANGTYRCTFSDLLIESDRTPDSQGNHGHHAIGLTAAIDNLVTDFVIAAPYVHDVTLEYGATGNVVRNGRGVDLSLDYHRQLPYSNLVTNVHAGAGNRPWKSGGESGEQKAPRVWGCHAHQSVACVVAGPLCHWLDKDTAAASPVHVAMQVTALWQGYTVCVLSWNVTGAS